MVGNALEQEIIGLYADNISSTYSINQIATRLGKKYPYINKKVTLLIKGQIFKKIVVGRSHLCSLNLKNDETIYLLILNEIRKKKKALESDKKLIQVSEYLRKISSLASTEIVLKQRNKLLFVLQRKEDVEQFEKSILKQALHPYEHEALTRQEFLSLLKEEKSLHQDHIIIAGFEKYYELIREIEDELRLRYSILTP